MNIFQNAQFGDRYQTRDGRMAIYYQCFNEEKGYHLLVIEPSKDELTDFRSYKEDGTYLYGDRYADDIITKIE